LEKSSFTPDNEYKKQIYSFNREKVLVVEDYQLNAMVIKKMLSNWNSDIDVASSAKEALIMYMKKRYDFNIDGYSYAGHG